MVKPTQEELSRMFNYDPETGIVTRKVRTSNRIKAGDVVGCLNGSGYLVCHAGSVKHYIHRIIWTMQTGEWPDQIDHINHKRDDNRWANLRESNDKNNRKNQSMSSANKSGYMGVSWYKATKKWQAWIYSDCQKIHLGHFEKKQDAIIARRAAEEKHGYHENHGGEI